MERELDLRLCHICKKFYIKEKIKKAYVSEEAIFIWVCLKCFSKLKSGQGIRARGKV